MERVVKKRVSQASGSGLRYEWIHFVCWWTKKRVKMDLKKNDWSKVSHFRMTLNDTSVSPISVVTHSSTFWTQWGTVSQLWHTLPFYDFLIQRRDPGWSAAAPLQTWRHTHTTPYNTMMFVVDGGKSFVSPPEEGVCSQCDWFTV